MCKGTLSGKPEFEAVYETYYDRLYKYAYTILLNRENAEDIVEETFLAAYAAYPGYDPSRASLATWLTRIAHNKAVSLTSSAAYRRKAELPENVDLPDPGGDFTARTEDADVVLWLYSHLSREERRFLDLRYVMELKDGEIAELLGIKTKAVNKRYQRLLARCRDILNREEKSF